MHVALVVYYDLFNHMQWNWDLKIPMYVLCIVAIQSTSNKVLKCWKVFFLFCDIWYNSIYLVLTITIGQCQLLAYCFYRPYFIVRGPPPECCITLQHTR